MGITVAVTGPTGEIGISTVDALERDPGVERILGMARRPFDPAAHGWTKTEYRQGDILDRAAVEDFVADADVVVHLAFLIMGSRTESARINLEGTRNVFEATVAAPRPTRLVYTSSVAAYGYHPDNRTPLTEDTPTRGSAEHYYSEQKAELERVLTEVTGGSDLEVFVLRPCIVAGPKAPALADSMPWRQLASALPGPLGTLVGKVPGPVFPDPGHPLQLVHHDDVAAAIAVTVTTDAEPGAFNIAGDGTVTLSTVASALGAIPVRVPAVLGTAASATLRRLPFVPSLVEWIHVARTSVVMDTSKAKRELGWHPQYSSKATLDELVASL
ncbi:NAD-dependent epimerase/dehydratase family protein [Rhodococcus sp. NPDC003994]|uniref:NAD-dependent epimerase/dehydratase family protein n=1 Tax=Rhodococcoides kroppenstedtii TaxID=293050 RepID=UPI001BDF0328|nr:NAD-dependent epimerase/dehydratase family protein [Rhodococcus kroppenstedtii]MBT1192182.1 NAD-dependent epimerase/dehydratase family protein [Rhodococcus kroppenstedtii]